MEPIISIRDLCYHYTPQIPILQNISMEIQAGESVAILGENGSGKSTLFLCMLDLIHAIQGVIRITGLEVHASTIKKIRQKTGLVFQESNDQLFLPTVRDEIGFGPYNLGMRDKVLQNHIDHILEELNLTDYTNAKTFNLSSGEKKRIAFAAVYSMSPEIYLLDEPFVGLDPRNREILTDQLRKIHEKQKTVVMITHEMDDIPSFIQRAIVLHEGRITYDGSISELYNQETLIKEANLKVPSIIQIYKEFKRHNIIPDSLKNSPNLAESISTLIKFIQK